MRQKVNTPQDDAIHRFQIIAPLLDDTLSKAEARVLREQIYASYEVSPRTLRRWQMQYREHGFEGLLPRERKDKGQRRALSDEAMALAQELRQELPERSAERIREVLLLRRTYCDPLDSGTSLETEWFFREDT